MHKIYRVIVHLKHTDSTIHVRPIIRTFYEHSVHQMQIYCDTLDSMALPYDIEVSFRHHFMDINKAINSRYEIRLV